MYFILIILRNINSKALQLTISKWNMKILYNNLNDISYKNNCNRLKFLNLELNVHFRSTM